MNRPNAQLSEKESVNVFVDPETDRILGMAPSSIKAPLVPGLRYVSRLLTHVSEIEGWLKKWREQVTREAATRTERQAKRDAIFRNAIASAIRARNQSVNPWNRDENNRLLAKMDADYDAKLKKQLKPQLFGMAESSEASKSAIDVSLDSPYFKHGPERIAQGDSVDPRDVQ